MKMEFMEAEQTYFLRLQTGQCVKSTVWASTNVEQIFTSFFYPNVVWKPHTKHSGILHFEGTVNSIKDDHDVGYLLRWLRSFTLNDSIYVVIHGKFPFLSGQHRNLPRFLYRSTPSVIGALLVLRCSLKLWSGVWLMIGASSTIFEKISCVKFEPGMWL